MIAKTINILLADDDYADCLLFKDALQELPVTAILTIVHNGEQVTERLTKRKNIVPDVLFLDINMPLKNGFATLEEIKRKKRLANLPVVIISTCSEVDAIKRVFSDGAHYYITKPAEFLQLKKVIYEALTLITQNKSTPLKENFMIKGDSIPIPKQH